MTLLDDHGHGGAQRGAEMGVVTIEMKTSFMQAARAHWSPKGRLIHRTATMAFHRSHGVRRQGRGAPTPRGPSRGARRWGPGSVNELRTIATD